VKEYWLSFRNGSEALRLPVTPSGYSYTFETDDVVKKVQDLGEILIPGHPKLKMLEFKSFFPAHDYPYVYSGAPSPYECIELIEKWMRTEEPIRLMITESNVNYPMRIKSFKPEDKENDGTGDVYYSMRLQEYIFIETKSVSKSSLSSGEELIMSDRPVDKETPKSVTIRSGDTLYAVAKRHLGDGAKWSEIADKNQIENPKAIQPGQVVYL